MSKVANTFLKAGSIEELISLDFLAPQFGDINSIEEQPLKTSSAFSGSDHKKIILHYKNREPISLVLKIVRPSKDMTIWRTGNIPDREVRLLGCRELDQVWSIIDSPYIGYYHGDKYSALLMHDLSNFLFPDVRQPILHEQEDLILGTLARVHARYWKSELDCKSWLTPQETFFNYLHPQSMSEEKAAGRDNPLYSSIQKGWDLVFEMLPNELKSFVWEPPIERMTEGLPKTVIHGDSKLGNLAIVPGGKLSAFDWTVVAYACPAIEIGWYITVNSSRLSTTKENVFNRYREQLEKELAMQFDPDTWQRILDLAILTGVRMLLWNKAMNVQKDLPGARAEWDWWVQHIRLCVNHQSDR